MNLAHPERNQRLAREVGQRLEKMRREAGVSAHELSLRVGKDRLYFYGIEDGQESLYLADFVALVFALGGDPVQVLAEAHEPSPE